MGSQKLVLEKEYPGAGIDSGPSAVGPAKFSVSFLTRSSSIAMLGGLLSQGLKFLVLVYVARQFSVSEFGLLSFAFAIYAYQFVICNSGLQFFGSRAVAKSGQVSSMLMGEICCLRGALAVIGTGGSLLLLAFLPGVSRTEFLLVTIFGLSNLPLAGFLDWAFQGLHRQEVSAILNVILQGLWFALTVLGVRFGMGIAAVPISLLVATLAASAIGYFWLTRTGCIGERNGESRGMLARSWQTLKSAAPLGSALWLNTVLIWTDAIIVRLLRGEQAVGWYAAGNRAGLALGMLAGYYLQGALPLLSQSSNESVAQFRLFFQHCYEDMALFFVPGSIWAIIYAREIILVLFKKPEYLAAVPVFQIFQLVFLMTALGNLHGICALVASHRDHEYRKGFIVAGAVFIPLCVILTRYQGILGAAIAALSVQALAVLLFAKASRDLVRVKHVSALALPIVLGSGVVLASKMLGLPLFLSAALLACGNITLLGSRVRMNYLRGAS